MFLLKKISNSLSGLSSYLMLLGIIAGHPPIFKKHVTTQSMRSDSTYQKKMQRNSIVFLTTKLYKHSFRNARTLFFLQPFCNLSRYIHTTRWCMGQRNVSLHFRHRSRTDLCTWSPDVHPVLLHIIELDFHTVKQSIIIGCTRSDLIQCVDHLDNSIQDSFRKHKA